MDNKTSFMAALNLMWVVYFAVCIFQDINTGSWWIWLHMPWMAFGIWSTISILATPSRGEPR